MDERVLPEPRASFTVEPESRVTIEDTARDDSTGDPVKAAQVLLHCGESFVPNAVRLSDGEGCRRFAGLTPRKASLAVRAEG